MAVPALLYLFHFSPLAATTASLAVVAATAAAGVVPRIKVDQVRLRQAVIFWALGIAGTFVGSQAAQLLPELILVTGFALVMVGAAVAMWRKSSRAEAEEVPHRAPWLLPLVAIGVGLLTGLFGVGGGFLIVPALVLVFGLPFKVATGTSLAVVAMNSVTALAFKSDTWSSVDWRVPLLMIAGGLVGSLLAAQLNIGLSRRLLERAFAGLLVLLAAWMMLQPILLPL